MEKCEYKRKLHERLHKLIDEPMTLGHIEEAGVIAGLLCDLDMLAGRKHEEPEHYALSEDEARAWVAEMENEDGSTGEHWTQEQTTAAARSIGVDAQALGTSAWYAAMNMIYSDYCAVAREYGVDRPDYYAKMARAFLMDRDGGGAEKKIAAYYRCVAGER